MTDRSVSPLRNRAQAGFTMVELMVSIGIATVLSGVLVTISLFYFGETVRSRVTAELAVESHFVLRTIVEDMRLADGLSQVSALEDANAPAGGWATSDDNNVLIIDSPATDSSDRIIYDPLTGYPYRNHLIYFIEDRTLHKRILKNENAPDNDAITTCPAASASGSCPTDRNYTADIDDLTFTFYDENNDETADPTQARSALVTVSMSRRTFGSTITFNNSIQTTLRNY